MDTLVKMTGDQIAKIPAGTVSKFSDDFWKAIPVNQVVLLAGGVLQAVCADVQSSNCKAVMGWDVAHIAAVSKDGWDGVPIDIIVGFSVTQLQVRYI